MMMDPTTESIAHFIGLFQLAIEELRLRQDYIEFRYRQAPPEEAPPHEIIGVDLRAPYGLQPYDPELAYRPEAPALPPVPHPHREMSFATPPVALPGPAAAAPAEIEHPRVVIAPPPAGFEFPLPPPASLVSITLQSAVMYDDDLFLGGLGTSFVNPGVLHDLLTAIVAQADALAGFAVPLLPSGSAGWIDFATGFLDQLDAATPPAGGEVSVLRGQEACGIVADGVAVEEAPEWSDLLPAYLKPDQASEEASAAAASDGGAVTLHTDGAGAAVAAEAATHDFSRDFEGRSEPDARDAGVEVVAGANTAINEVVIASQWLDAPVILVRGDVARLHAVSQVNVLVEHDTIDGVAAGQQSLGINVAEIAETSSREDAAVAASEVLPSSSQVMRIETDLIQVNWVKQFTFATDFDRAEVTFSGSSLFLGLGENEILNSAVLNEFGYGFDLISVAGDMVDATIVSQTNVLFDSDWISTGGSAARGAEAGNAAPPPATAESGGDEAADEDAGLASFARTTVVEGGDAEAGAPLAERAPGTPEDHAPMEVAEAAPPVAISTADNLLYNKVTLQTTGVDTFADMTEVFARTAEDLAEGAEALAAEAARDAMFAGRETLRVLQVDGDLVKVNLVEQMNVIGDADQIRLEMQALRDQLEAEMQLIAGSNALVNVATVVDYGVDSQIMSGGRIYDDALIHQAGLFDTDAPPDGVALSALASEAIAAFLADDMASPLETQDEIAPTGHAEAPAHLDVLQTALT